MPQLNPNNVSCSLVSLLPMADKWGVGDDFERENAVSQASLQEVVLLIHCSGGISDEDLDGWLSGPEALNSQPFPEYLAITSL